MAGKTTARPNPARDGYRSPANHPPASPRGKVYGIAFSVLVVVLYFTFMTGGGGDGATSDIDNEWASVYPSQQTEEANSPNLRGSDVGTIEETPNLDSILDQEPTTQSQEPSVEDESVLNGGFDEYDKETLEEDMRQVENAVQIAKMELEELVEEEVVIDTEIRLEDKIDESKSTIKEELTSILKVRLTLFWNSSPLHNAHFIAMQDLDIPADKKSDEFINILTTRIVENLKDQVDADINKSAEILLEEMDEEIDEVVEEDELFGADAVDEISDIENVLDDAREEIEQDFAEMAQSMESSLEGRTDAMMESVVKNEVGVTVDVKGHKKKKKKQHDNEEIDQEVYAAKIVMEEAEEEEVILAISEIDALLEQKRSHIEKELVELFDNTLDSTEVNNIVTRIVEKVRAEADDKIEGVGVAALEDKEAEMDRAVEDDKNGDFFTQEQIKDEVEEIEEETLEKLENDVEDAKAEIVDSIDKKIDTELKKEIVEQAKKSKKHKKETDVQSESEKKDTNDSNAEEALDAEESMTEETTDEEDAV